MADMTESRGGGVEMRLPTWTPWTPTKINTAPDPAHDTVRNFALVSNHQVQDTSCSFPLSGSTRPSISLTSPSTYLLLGETSARFRQPLAPRWPPALGIDGWSNYLPFGNFAAFHARTRAGHVACTTRRASVEACHISTSSARMGHPGLTSHRTSCLFVVAMVSFAGEPKRCQAGLFTICFLFPCPVSPSTSLPFPTFFTCASQSRSFGPIDIRILQIAALRCCTFITRHDT